MSRYKVGDIVKITNGGHRYNLYYDRMLQYFKNSAKAGVVFEKDSGCYKFKDFEKHIYKVEAVGDHFNGVYYIKSNQGCNIIIGESGLGITIERF